MGLRASLLISGQAPPPLSVPRLSSLYLDMAGRNLMDAFLVLRKLSALQSLRSLRVDTDEFLLTHWDIPGGFLTSLTRLELRTHVPGDAPWHNLHFGQL